MDRTKCALVSKEIQSAIAEVLERHGLDLVGVRGSYSDVGVDYKVTLTEKADESLGYNPNTREAQVYVEAASVYDLPPLGTVIVLKDSEYRIVGWNNRAQKMPVIATRLSDGGSVKISEDAVRRAVARASA